MNGISIDEDWANPSLHQQRVRDYLLSAAVKFLTNRVGDGKVKDNYKRRVNGKGLGVCRAALA